MVKNWVKRLSVNAHGTAGGPQLGASHVSFLILHCHVTLFTLSEFSLNCEQHTVDRSGNSFFPVFLSVKFVQATEKFYEQESPPA